MTNFNHGHSAFFWDLLIQALEDDGLENDRKRILLISPWIVDLPIRTSNMDSSVFSMLLGDSKKRGLQNLSDVLEAMTDLGFQIDVVTLDSATKGLPKNDRRWLQREEEFVKKLLSKGISVWKKMGLHAKMYLFPHGALTGSVNLTRQGFFANAENITHCLDEDYEEYESVVINADAQLRGSIHYFDRGGPRPERLVLPPEHVDEPTGEFKIDTGSQNSTDEDDYVHPPLIPLGHISNSGSHFIDADERRALTDHLLAFEEELREVILHMYKQEAHELVVWAEMRKRGEIPSKPRAMWTKLLIVNHDKESLHERARKHMFEYKSPPYAAEDFPNGKIPDPNNLSHQTVLTYGTTLGDLRTCIIGDTNNIFHDFVGTNLQNKTLNRFTRSMLGVRVIDDERVRYFWLRLFGPEEAFTQINFARNELFHSKPLPRHRAIKCQQALMDFERKLLVKFNEFISS
jgi:hypothetical protein